MLQEIFHAFINIKPTEMTHYRRYVLPDKQISMGQSLAQTLLGNPNKSRTSPLHRDIVSTLGSNSLVKKILD